MIYRDNRAPGRPFKIRFTLKQKVALVAGLVVCSPIILVVGMGMVIEKEIKKSQKAIRRQRERRYFEAERRRLRWKKEKMDNEVVECVICAEEKKRKHFSKNKCGCEVCNECWKQYLTTDHKTKEWNLVRGRKLKAEVAKPAPSISCMCCDDKLEIEIIGKFAPPSLVKVVKACEEREKYIPAPRKMKVLECKIARCPGVAYDDFKQRTAMCFVCGEVWELQRKSVLRSAVHPFVKLYRSYRDRNVDRDIRKGLSREGWRKCPHCGMATIKNGGCHNMVCTFCNNKYTWDMFGNYK